MLRSRIMSEGGGGGAGSDASRVLRPFLGMPMAPLLVFCLWKATFIDGQRPTTMLVPAGAEGRTIGKADGFVQDLSRLERDKTNSKEIAGREKCLGNPGTGGELSSNVQTQNVRMVVVGNVLLVTAAYR